MKEAGFGGIDCRADMKALRNSSARNYSCRRTCTVSCTAKSAMRLSRSLEVSERTSLSVLLPLADVMAVGGPSEVGVWNDDDAVSPAAIACRNM